MSISFSAQWLVTVQEMRLWVASGAPAYSAVAANSTKARMGNTIATFVVAAGLGVNASAAAHLVGVIVRQWAATGVAVAPELKVPLAAESFAGPVQRGTATGVVVALESNVTVAANT